MHRQMIVSLEGWLNALRFQHDGVKRIVANVIVYLNTTKVRLHQRVGVRLNLLHLEVMQVDDQNLDVSMNARNTDLSDL